MSNNFINIPLSKIFLNRQDNEKKSKSQLKYMNAPDIITQAKPSYLNNFVLPINPHESSLTPSNHSNKLNNIEKFLLPPKSESFADKKTLILDLDETLVHSSFTPFKKNDIVLEVDFEGVMYNIYVLVRPYAEDFLKNMSKYFEIIIFTASISKYASPLLDIIDKDKNIKYRLFRDHCTYINGIFIKDLKRLNRNLEDVIIVDNSPLAYAFDSDNGLPIKTWYDDPDDIELMKIEPLIIFLSQTKDVRKYIDKFVDDNEILYNEAMTIINCYKNNKINNLNIDIEEKNITENNSDLDNSNINNVINKNNQLNDYKINTLNMMKNIKLNLFSFNNIAGIKNYNTTNNNTLNKNLLNKTDNDNDNNNNNKKGNVSMNNRTEKNNELLTKDKNKNNSKNKKPNISIFLRKPSSKKKNIFRISQKPDDPTLNIMLNGTNKNLATNSFYNNFNNNNNNNNTLMPLVLPFSNTSKNVLEQTKTNINSNNRINIIPIHMTKNGSIDNKKKLKYTNLLENINKNGKIINKELEANYLKNNNIRISSSIINYHNRFLSNRFNENIISKDKKFDFLYIPKSNSINNVLKFNNLGNKNLIKNNLESKTPNRHPISIFGKSNLHNLKLNQKGKKNMLYNLIKGIDMPHTGRSSNILYSAKPSNIRNCSSCKRKNKFI